jgi:hypothetical protein
MDEITERGEALRALLGMRVAAALDRIESAAPWLCVATHQVVCCKAGRWSWEWSMVITAEFDNSAAAEMAAAVAAEACAAAGMPLKAEFEYEIGRRGWVVMDGVENVPLEHPDPAVN